MPNKTCIICGFPEFCLFISSSVFMLKQAKAFYVFDPYDAMFMKSIYERKEGNVLFNDALNTFYLRLYSIRHMVQDHSDCDRGNPLPQHGYFFRLTARVLLYAPSHRQDSIYHSLCYTSRGALARTRNSSMGPPWRIDPTIQCTLSEHL